MSAPIAVGTTGGLTGLVFTSSPSKSLLDSGACGDAGEGEHFPASRSGSGSGRSAAGQQLRSTTYPQVVLVNLPRRAIAQALVLALTVTLRRGRRSHHAWKASV